MDPGTLIILISAAIVLGILLFQYLFKVLFNKSADAIGNARRQRRNEKNGPEILLLRNLYPELAARHVAAGTATEMNPLLLQPDSASENAVSADVQRAGNTASAGVAAGMGTVPIMYPVPEKKRSGAAVMLIFGLVSAVLGIGINGLILWMVPLFSQMNHKTPAQAYLAGMHRALLALILLSVLAFAVLLIKRRVVYTLFWPVLSTVIAIGMLVITNRYIGEYMDEAKKYRGRSYMPHFWEEAESGSIWLVVLASLLLVCFVLFAWKGWRWTLWCGLLFGIGASAAAGFAIGRMCSVDAHLIAAVGNFAGYGLLFLLFGYAERRGEK